MSEVGKLTLKLDASKAISALDEATAAAKRLVDALHAVADAASALKLEPVEEDEE